MTKDYVTKEQLDERLKDIKVNGFSQYSGKALKGLVSLVRELAGIAIIAGSTAYCVMTLAYGPYDTGKVIYAELSGNKNLKHKHVETAKSFYAKRLQKQELDERDMKNLFIELGAVEAEGKKPTEEALSWYNLLDWIEDND